MNVELAGIIICTRSRPTIPKYDSAAIDARCCRCEPRARHAQLRRGRDRTKWLPSSPRYEVRRPRAIYRPVSCKVCADEWLIEARAGACDQSDWTPLRHHTGKGGRGRGGKGLGVGPDPRWHRLIVITAAANEKTWSKPLVVGGGSTETRTNDKSHFDPLPVSWYSRYGI